MEILNSKVGLELVDNDKELYQILIDTFISESKFDLNELKKLITDGKMNDAAGYVHAVKGAGRQIGTERLMTIGQKLEDVLRGKADGNIENLSKIMLEEFELAIKTLKEFKF